MQTIDLSPKLFLAYSEKSDGNIDKRFSPADTVKANRRALFKALNRNIHNVFEAQQVHSDIVLRFDAENSKMWRGQTITGIDGFVTNQTDVILLLRLADCAPVVLFDPKKPAVGLVHAGWKGTVKNIQLKALNLLNKEYASVPEDLKVWIGPCAQQCCYSISEKPEQLNDPQWQPFIKVQKNAWFIDLPGYITQSLVSQGVLKKNITVSSECTVTSDSLFSHKRSLATKEPEGRFAVIAQLNS